MSYVITSSANSTFLSPSGYWQSYAEAAVFASREEAQLFIARTASAGEALVVDTADLDESTLLLDYFLDAVDYCFDSEGNVLYLDAAVMGALAARMSQYVQPRQPFELAEATSTPKVDIDAVRALATSPDGPLMARVSAEVWHACCDAIAATASPEPEPEPRADDPTLAIRRDGPVYRVSLPSGHFPGSD